MKIYKKFPEILDFKTKILDSKYKNNLTRLKLEKTIFIPDSPSLKADYKSVDSREVLSYEENSSGFFATVRGKLSKKELVLRVDKKLRYKNLKLITGFILFKIMLYDFYGPLEAKLINKNMRAYIKIRKPYTSIDFNLLEELVNYAIDSNLPIDTKDNLTTVKNLGSVKNPYTAFDRSLKVKNFKILNVCDNYDYIFVGYTAG